MSDVSNTKGISRADVLRLGREGEPAQFLPVALQVLRATVDDAIRLLAATAAERFGLPTMARDLWRGISQPVRDLAEVVGIAEGSRALVDADWSDEVKDVETLSGAAKRRLHAHHPGVRTAFDGLTLPGTFHRAFDGMTLWRMADGVWRGFGPVVDEGIGAVVDAQHESGFPPPLVVAGCEPWSILFGVLHATEAERSGYRIRVGLVEPDAAAVLAACVCVPRLTEMLADARVECFVGPRCLDELCGVWSERLDCTLPKRVLSVQPELRRQVSGVLEALHETQQTEFAKRRETVRVLGLTGANGPRADPSVRSALVLTSRFTTFVRHSVEGLVAALERAGVRTTVLMEPDAYSTLSAVAYLRSVMGEAEGMVDVPDVVIGSNCTRAWFKDMIPTHVPFIGWLQDAIPKLFDDATARAQGPRDVLVGYVFTELAQQHGFDPERMEYSGVPIDGERFHAGPVSKADRERFACDIAMVSHHSETPDAMRQRLVAEIGRDDGMRRLLEGLVPAIEDAARHANTDWPFSRLRSAVRAAGGGGLSEATVTAIVRQFALPLADRILRHESLAWAADVAQERGLSLHLYGRGWERHPTLQRFAKGPLPHSDELRAAYACAQLNLHVSITTLVHQRISECALSGGLCVARYHRDAISGPRASAMLELIQNPPDVVDEANGRIGFVVADHPAAMRQHLLFTRLGEPTDGPVLWVNAARAARAATQGRLIDHDQDADQLFGDLAELTYQSKAGLESLIERSAMPSWRQAHSERIANYARQRLSFDTLVQRMMRAIGAAEMRENSGTMQFPSPSPLVERVA